MLVLFGTDAEAVKPFAVAERPNKQDALDGVVCAISRFRDTANPVLSLLDGARDAFTRRIANVASKLGDVLITSDTRGTRLRNQDTLSRARLSRTNCELCVPHKIAVSHVSAVHALNLYGLQCIDSKRNLAASLWTTGSVHPHGK